MNVRQALHVLWLRRWLTILTIATAMTAATAVGLVVPPRYEATSRVMLAMFKPDPVTGDFVNGKTLPAYIATQAEMVGDYRVSGRVVDALGWTSSPELLASYEARDPSDTRDFRRWLAQRISDNTGVGLAPETNIMEIKFGSGSPEQAARLADAVRDAFVAQDLAQRREDAETTAAWLTRQVEATGASLREAVRRQQDFERANGVLLRNDGVDTESFRLEAAAHTGPRPALPVKGPDTGLAAQLQAADAALAGAEKVLGPNNPDLKEARGRRDVLAAAVARSGAAPVVVAPAGESYDAVAARVLARSGKVAEAQRLAADVSILRAQYDASTKRLAALRQESQVEAGGLQPMGEAAIPTERLSPNWLFLLPGSAVLGLLLGCVVSLLAELLGQRVRGSADLAFADVPLLGELSGAPRLKRSRWAALRRRFGLRRRRAVAAAG